jgi:hypothetical protein
VLVDEKEKESVDIDDSDVVDVRDEPRIFKPVKTLRTSSSFSPLVVHSINQDNVDLSDAENISPITKMLLKEGSESEEDGKGGRSDKSKKNKKDEDKSKKDNKATSASTTIIAADKKTGKNNDDMILSGPATTGKIDLKDSVVPALDSFYSFEHPMMSASSTLGGGGKDVFRDMVRIMPLESLEAGMNLIAVIGIKDSVRPEVFILVCAYLFSIYSLLEYCVYIDYIYMYLCLFYDGFVCT